MSWLPRQMRRRNIIAGLASIWPLVTRAQPRRIYVIVWVSTEAQPDPLIAGFREGMRSRGYVEGQNLTFVTRYAPGDPAAIKAMLPELLKIPADLIVSSGPAMQAATGKPVLFAISGDPVELGLAQSLSRPGRNFTGSTFLSLELAQRRVQLLKEMVPDLRTIAVLSNTTHPGERSEHEATEKAAGVLAVRLAYVPFSSDWEIDDALGRVRDSGANALLVFPEGVTMVHRAKIAQFAKTHRLPSMFGWREYCEAGGLASYGANQRETYVRLAAYGDRLLRGDKPADLPIEQATKFELVINASTAKALGLDIAVALMATADDVIE
jgi:putative tryptophan/tyrosine transport system substrate-binding protein